jgi:hypothetical protein
LIIIRLSSVHIEKNIRNLANDQCSGILFGKEFESILLDFSSEFMVCGVGFSLCFGDDPAVLWETSIVEVG